MRELLSDLCDLFPYCLLVALPVFIALSPVNPVEAAGGADFAAHRASHLEVGGGGVLGSRSAAMSLEARAFVSGGAGGGGGGQNVLRKVVVAKLQGKQGSVTCFRHGKVEAISMQRYFPCTVKSRFYIRF